MMVQDTLTIGTHAIRRDGDMWCITDLWQAAGAPKAKRPVDYSRTSECESFGDFLRLSPEVLDSHVWKTRRFVGGGETWAHWQLALAYAKWVDHSFHARVNDVYRAFTAGQLVTRQDDDVIRLSLRIQALEAKDYESAWDRELKIEFARLRRLGSWEPGAGPEPQGLSFAYGRTLRVILGDSVYEELKKRNPAPRDGSLHGQWLAAERLRLLKREDLHVTLYIARQATRWTDFERQMRAHFRRAPLQLQLAPPLPPTKPRKKGSGP